MAPIQLRTRVGPNGVLTLNVPVGLADADREVNVTVQPLQEPTASQADREAWERFVSQTAGGWQGEPLVRPPQGDYEAREEWE